MTDPSTAAVARVMAALGYSARPLALRRWYTWEGLEGVRWCFQKGGTEWRGESAREMVDMACEAAPLRVIAEALTELGAEVPQGPEPLAERVADALLRAVEDAPRERERERSSAPREWRIGDECEVLFDVGCAPEWRAGVVCDHAKSEAFAGRYRVADRHREYIAWSTWAHPSEMRERGR